MDLDMALVLVLDPVEEVVVIKTLSHFTHNF